MRVRYLVFNAWGGGGTISTTLTNASTLARRGHDVEVISVIRRHDEVRFPHDGVKLTALIDLREPLRKQRKRLHKQPSREVPTDENRYDRFSELTDVVLRRHLGGLEDGVVIGTRPGLNLAVARHAPDGVIRIGQEHLFLDIHKDKPEQLAAMRRDYPRLDQFVCLTSDDARDYAEAFDVRTTAIPNALRTPGEPATAQTLRDSRIIIAAGRLSGQKGFERLVEAMALIGPDSGWRARIYGTGAQEGMLRDLIASTGAPVDLMGFTTDLDGELRKAGIFAMTSRFEGFPMVLLEGMGAGLPVVTCAFRTGCRDLVTDGKTGLIVAQDDVPAFADALRALMADADRRVAMGAAGRAVTGDYTPDAIADRWEALFDDLRPRGWRRLRERFTPRR